MNVASSWRLDVEAKDARETEAWGLKTVERASATKAIDYCCSGS